MPERRVKAVWLVWRYETHIYCGEPRRVLETDGVVHESEALANKSAEEAREHHCQCVVRRYPAPRSLTGLQA